MEIKSYLKIIPKLVFGKEEVILLSGAFYKRTSYGNKAFSKEAYALNEKFVSARDQMLCLEASLKEFEIEVDESVIKELSTAINSAIVRGSLRNNGFTQEQCEAAAQLSDKLFDCLVECNKIRKILKTV